MFVDNLKKTWNDFDASCNPMQFGRDAIDIANTHNPELVNKCIAKHIALFHEKYSTLENMLVLDYLRSKEKETAKEMLAKYKKTFFEGFNDKNLALLMLNSQSLFSHIVRWRV